MAESNEDNEIVETELKMIRNKLNGMHDTLKISLAYIVVLLILVVIMLWTSPTF
jgi:hypothetical protein